MLHGHIRGVTACRPREANRYCSNELHNAAGYGTITRPTFSYRRPL